MSCRESYKDMIDHRSCTHNLRLRNSSRPFCRRTADFSRLNGLKFVGPSAYRTLADNRAEAWGRVIQYQDGAYSTDVTRMTFHIRPFQ